MSHTESLRLLRDPGQLFREVGSCPPGSWVVVDEVQKVPALLDEVQRLMEGRGLRFALSGSSARKLRRGGSNLLAGRALVRHLYPLVSAEVSFSRPVHAALEFGMLPVALAGPDPAAFLAAYAETYLQEEIRAEALTRNLGGFSRFLEIAARQNGQVTNVAAIARDAAVSRQTVQNYFDILVDTLLGTWLPPWKLKRATKQVQHAKFHLFDAGVARALSGRLPYPPSREEMGPLLETVILHELRAYLEYTARPYPLHFWRSYDGVEVDVLFETPGGFVAIEIKASTRWDKRFQKGLNRMCGELGAARVRTWGVYLGETAADWDATHVLPAMEFLQRLWGGNIVPNT